MYRQDKELEEILVKVLGLKNQEEEDDEEHIITAGQRVQWILEDIIVNNEITMVVEISGKTRTVVIDPGNVWGIHPTDVQEVRITNKFGMYELWQWLASCIARDNYKNSAEELVKEVTGKDIDEFSDREVIEICREAGVKQIDEVMANEFAMVEVYHYILDFTKGIKILASMQ